MKVLSGEGEAQRVLELHQVRHPLVELQESVSYIANDVAFAPATSTLHLITGPNMGGKSTYIRSVGVAVLMAQMGSFIPADAGSKMSVVGKLNYLRELPSLSVSKALFF
jgi:DNA mismatch repair protein MSH2